jgi:hypothetical protein
VTERFPGPSLSVHITVDGMVELEISHGDGRQPSVIKLNPDHAKWVAEQIRDGAQLAEKHIRWSPDARATGT